MLSVLTAAARGFPLAGALWDILYFSLMTSIFTWITSPPDMPVKLSGAVRIIAGSCLGAVLFAVVFFRAMSTPGFSEYLGSLINGFLSLYRSSGSDVVEAALLESLTADAVLSVMKSVILRGGSLITCVFLFFINRQVCLAVVRLSFRGRRVPSSGASSRPHSFAVFHANPGLIWVLSFSLLLVVVTRMVKLEIPEIVLWNILILCIILYFAQGLGIMQFFLTRNIVPPFLRFFLVVLFIILIFSPIINAILLAGIVLLGISENWVPFRAPKQNGPPSTPEAGDSGN